MKKSILRKKEIIYNSGEIEKIEFQKTKKGEYGYIYKLEIISKKRNKIIFSKDYQNEFFTNEEIDIFYVKLIHILKLKCKLMNKKIKILILE